MVISPVIPIVGFLQTVLDRVVRRYQKLCEAVVPGSKNYRYVFIVNGFGLGCLGLGLFGHVNWLVYN